jgi:hypothetical protein
MAIPGVVEVMLITIPQVVAVVLAERRRLDNRQQHKTAYQAFRFMVTGVRPLASMVTSIRPVLVNLAMAAAGLAGTLLMTQTILPMVDILARHLTAEDSAATEQLAVMRLQILAAEVVVRAMMAPRHMLEATALTGCVLLRGGSNW